MKIQCNACEAAEATVLCCADEAALCRACDKKVHAANKLASKHQRVPLTAEASSQVPKCDICQEALGYFFCLEDRALLCRACDVAIHTVNSHVSAHRRFLLTGVRVGPEPSESDLSFTTMQPSVAPPKSLSHRSISTTLSGDNNEAVSKQKDSNGSLPGHISPFAGGTITGSLADWPLNEFFGMDFNQNYGLSGHESSKADSGWLGSSEDSQIYRPVDEELDFCTSQVPEIHWTVPEISSPPPTASGLSWPKTLSHSLIDDIMFVPEVCASSCRDTNRYQHSTAAMKRRRRSR